ncbi:MAG: hypothetical protein ACKN94_01820 [Pirellulaceae bacterium]
MRALPAGTHDLGGQVAGPTSSAVQACLSGPSKTLQLLGGLARFLPDEAPGSDLADRRDFT